MSSWLMAHLVATSRPPTERAQWAPVAQIVDPQATASSLKEVDKLLMVLKDKAATAQKQPH
jgi:hypothetical protein